MDASLPCPAGLHRVDAEHPLTIGGISVIWMLDSAVWEDGTPVPPDELRAAGIRVPRKLLVDDD